MRQTDALSRIHALGRPMFETDDVAALLQTKSQNASKILARLKEDRLLIRLSHGKWALANVTDRLSTIEFLTNPFPTYVSLHTALYYHGMISQIPSVTYGVTLARSRVIRTPIGEFSLHHIEPSFFFGFDVSGMEQAQMASPEKALLDIFYLSAGRLRLFESLPEVEIPKSFRFRTAEGMIRKIPSLRKRTIVARRFAEMRDRFASL